MSARLAARAADTEALLARFNAAATEALAAIEHADVDALSRALDVRDAIAGEVARAGREVAQLRARFTVDAAGAGGRRLADAAVARLCAPLEALARSAWVLQERLELSAGDARAILAAQLSALDANGPLVSRYASAEPAPDRAHLDVVL